MHNNINIKGEVFITLKKSNGEVVNEYVHNVVTNEGKEFLTKKIFESNSDARIAQIGVGTNHTEHTVNDTFTTFNDNSPTFVIKKDIDAESSAIQTSPPVDNVITYIATFFDTEADTLGGGTPVPMKEVALIGYSNDTPYQEVLVCRTTFDDDSPVVGFLKSAQDIVTITWKLTIN